NAAHADALTLEACVGASPLVSGVTPDFGVNDGQLMVTITGANFSGTPTVILAKSGAQVTADTVQVVNSSTINATFDLTGASSGRYSVIVKQGGCIGSQLGVEVLVAATEFVNGSFEEPFAGDIVCDPVPAPVPGL